MTSNEERVLGLDFGNKRIGVAVSAPLNLFASPLETITYTKASDAIQRLITLTKNYNVQTIVVGLPKHISGKEGVLAKQARDFGKKLAEETFCEIVFEDERYTSKIAEQSIRESGKSPSRNKAQIDQTAACLILESYLKRNYISD